MQSANQITTALAKLFIKWKMQNSILEAEDEEEDRRSILRTIKSELLFEKRFLLPHHPHNMHSLIRRAAREA